MLNPDCFFSPEPSQRAIARELYLQVKDQPIISPHGHVDPGLFADEQATFGNPSQLFIIPDHYVFRMLYSQGIPYEAIGIPRRDRSPVETDPRKIWQIFADNYYLFRGTPTGAWLDHELLEIFNIPEKLHSTNAQHIYDQLCEKLTSPEFSPRRLYERFNIKVLCTTDAASDPLTQHRSIQTSGWNGIIRPTFRPDGVINLLTPGWRDNLCALENAYDHSIDTCQSLIAALENRLEYFKLWGAVATDHSPFTPYTEELNQGESEHIFLRALKGTVSEQEAIRFSGHMLIQIARMCSETGLVMQLHPGSFRNHYSDVYDYFGPDKGFDIPIQVEFTRNLRPLLGKFGNHPNLTLILFTLDETLYARELAPLAGAFPAIKLGPPWWFHDSPNGIRRYLEQVVETAGIANLAGFNDDTRASTSIPARHDLWRRICSDWLAGMVVQHRINIDDAYEMNLDLAINLAKNTYRLERKMR
jgi:glucuronate isomerase